MELKVALCQFDMVWEDTAANLRTAGRMVAEADADLVILPEMFATGFETDPGRVAQPMSGEIVQEMTRWGRTTGKAVAGSLIVEEEGRYYNRLLFIKPSGERVQSDKRHLFSIGGEGANFCPGRERVVVEYGGIRFLLQVCYDLRFPVWSRCRNDYDAIIYVASWPAGRRDVWRTLLRARAIENQAYVLGVNRTGDDPRLHYSGDSAVIGCKGETLAEAGEGQRLLTARLDMDELRRFNFCPGRERVVVEYGGIRFLLQVCYDLRFPVWSRCRNDYDAIIYVASWPAGRRDVWRTLLRARAIENQAYVLGVNRTGDDPRLHYSGDSAVIGCKGETLAEAGEGQRLLTARLDMDELRRFREKFPAWRDADDFDLK